MKANLSQREPAMLERWRQLDIYGELRRRGAGKPRYVLHDGPPYANGEIHIGHVVNKVLKDIIVKAKTLDGFDAPYVPGWDCHGLPIELNVEKKVGRPGQKLDARGFRQACRDYAAKQVDRQREDFKRLGVLGDWDRPYLTMDHAFEANIVRSLARVIANGHLHKGFKPVHWCVDCRSALAEAEVEYDQRTSPAIDVRFEVLDAEALLARCEDPHVDHGQGSISVVIWTTTPWTLPANQAVAVHPELEYVLLQCDGVGDHGPERLLVAESLHKQCMGRYGVDDYQVLATCRGADLEGLALQHPFLAREVPVILGEHVTTEAGTGAVHTAPGHGQDDYVVGARYRLKVDNPVGPDGRFDSTTEHFGGQPVFSANDSVLEVLKERGKLVHHAKLEHSYPHCWRHKTPIIFRATPQWFISMEQKGLRGRALEEIERVAWAPDWGQARIQAMVSHRPDWCISRQRTWGVPIPLFVHRQSSELHPRTAELLEEVARRIEAGGVDAWFELESKELLGEEATQYDKVNDTLDVWFDSGVTHACVLEAFDDLGLPADLYLEGSDQHRGWFQSSLLTAVAMRGEAPYKQVLTHGFTVDAKGMKMSKSRGNVVAPQKVVNTLGADILRLWVAAADYRGEMSVSDEILKRTADAYRRIRNTMRFLLANLHGFDPAAHILHGDELLALDHWVMDRAARLQDELRAAYDKFQFHLVYQKLHHFCAVDLGAFYLDIIKDRQYTTQSDSLARRSTQTAMYHILEAAVRWMAPVLSFTAEEVWSNMPGDRGDSVLLEQWYKGLPRLADSAVMNSAFWGQVMEVREAVSKELERLRVAGEIGSSLDAEVELFCGQELYGQLREFGDELRFVLMTSEAQVHREGGHNGNDVHFKLRSNDELWIRVISTAHSKCVRCWHHRADVGSDPAHPQLCGRCVENVEGQGERRRYV